MACPQARDSIGKEAECEEFVITIPPELPLINIPSDLPPAERSECCIYRVPKQLRKVNEEAYTPKLVSIGPFHHSRKELRDMEMHKLRYLNDFLKGTGKRQEDLLKIIKDNEEKIRHCYSEDPLKIIKDNEEKINHCYSEDDWRLESNDFVQMILLDAIFIIELFLKATSSEEEKDYILSKPWLRNGILHDLILLENQLPFFVIEELYMFAFNDSSNCNHGKEGKQIEGHKEDLEKQYVPFVKLSRNYFSSYDKKQESIISEKVKHFTDLLRYLLCPPDIENWINGQIRQWCITEEGSPDPNPRFCATKLDDAGLKFQEAKGDRRLLEIKLPGCSGRFPCFALSVLLLCLPCLICLICFPSLTCVLRCFGCPMHVLEVPQLLIDDATETLLRNLMALEQCHYPSKTYICSYVLLFDHLIDTEKDVDLLVDKKVIANHLGSNAKVAKVINKLSNQIVETESSYDHIAQELNKHYDYPLNHFLATLKREYFPNIFRGTATVVGLIILGFTLWNFIRPFVV